MITNFRKSVTQGGVCACVSVHACEHVRAWLCVSDLHVCGVWDGLSSALWLDTPSSLLTLSGSHPGGAGSALDLHPWLAQDKKFYSFIVAGSRTGTRVINTACRRGNGNERGPAREPRPATAWWSLWEGCCSKLSECPAGAPSPWLNGWRGGLRVRQPARRGPRLWRAWMTCPGRRSPASPGTCSPDGGYHGCTSYR